MRKKIFILSILISLLPITSFAKAHQSQGAKTTFSLQKKHSPVVDKAVEIYNKDMWSLPNRRGGNITLYQLDMASNKDMKELGEQRVPIMSFITKRDAYWLGVRKGKVIIVGSNGRGTAYGLMQLLQMGGNVNDRYETTQIPSVEFRGISMEDVRLSGNDCRRLFQMMMKLRANTLCAGWDDANMKLRINKTLRAVADSFGIDLATPHDDRSVRLHGHKKDGQTVDIAWADDGYGYIRQTDDDDDGGAVYHLSHKGRPHDYLWLSATQPGLIANEMLTAYQHGATKMWLAAVHNPNVAAYPLNLFMDLAWDVDTLKTRGVEEHIRRWLTSRYGSDVADMTAKPMVEYYRLAGICRPDFMDKIGYNDFNAEEFGNELERYLNDYRDVFKKVKAANDAVDYSGKNDFFASVGYPILASALMADKSLQAQESRLIGRIQSFHIDDEALESAARSMKAYWALQSLTDEYNTDVKGLYWNKPMNSHLSVFKSPSLTDTVSIAEVEKYYNPEPVYAPLSDDGCIVRNAAMYSSASGGARKVDVLGHSMQAVELQKDYELTYDFRTNDDFGGVLRLAFVPAFSTDGKTSQCSISIDGGSPTTIIVNDGTASSSRWAKGVTRGQTVVTLPVSLTSGSHTLTVKALNDHVIFDQWMLDRDVDREFYVFPTTTKTTF